ncbi:MAG: hypothetical protein ACI9MC_002583 [Kiritimatiellia bacterium]
MSGLSKRSPSEKDVPSPMTEVSADVDSDMGNSAMVEDAGLTAAKRPLDDRAGDARQDTKHLALIYDKAATALIGLGSETERVAGATGGTAKVCAELKGRERALQKIESDYDGHPERLVDVARASVFYDTDEGMKDGVALIRKSMDVVRVKNNFELPKGGYRDYNFNVRIDGHVCELQVHLTAIIEAKKEGHDDYEVVREIEARQKNGDPITPDDLKLLGEKRAAMWKLYNDAYAGAGGKVTEEERSHEPETEKA